MAELLAETCWGEDEQKKINKETIILCLSLLRFAVFLSFV
jgi:hypothetical protein